MRTFPGFGAYHASKWAVEGLSQTLAAEVASFGIHITIVEPGPYRTDFGGGSLRQSRPNPDYDGVRAASAPQFELGDPTATRKAILEVVDTDAPPLRIFLGMSFKPVEAEYRQRLDTWRAWQPVSVAAFGCRLAPKARGAPCLSLLARPELGAVNMTGGQNDLKPRLCSCWVEGLAAETFAGIAPSSLADSASTGFTALAVLSTTVSRALRETGVGRGARTLVGGRRRARDDKQGDRSDEVGGGSAAEVATSWHGCSRGCCGRMSPQDRHRANPLRLCL